MRFVVLSWIIASGLFFAGWFLGVIMARRQTEPGEARVDSFCETCYLRRLEAEVALEPIAR